MKIRFIAILYTLLIALFMSGVLLKINNEVSDSIDMVKLNRDVQAAAGELEEGASTLSIEKKYNCNITYLSDENYDAIIDNAISSGDILVDLKEDDIITGKIVFLRGCSIYRTLRTEWIKRTVLIGVFSLSIGYGLMLWIYIRYIRPFKNLNNFAGEIAKGNFDVPLFMQRHNYFGVLQKALI